MDDIAKRIQGGETIDFDAAELDRLGELRRAFLAVTPTVLVVYLLRLIAPVSAFFAFLGLLYLALRFVNR